MPHITTVKINIYPDQPRKPENIFSYSISVTADCVRKFHHQIHEFRK